MAYKLTPYDRRVQAELIRKEREARYASRYPTYKKTGAAAVAPVQDEKEKNGFVTALHTAGDVGANLLTGLGKGVEGIVDLFAGIGGAVAGIFSDDAENAVKNWISTDWTGELYGNAWQEGLDQSALNGTKAGEIIEGIAQGVGQMLPAVAVSFIPGVGQGVAVGLIAGSAAGTGAEQAFQEGAGYGQGMLYGAASGAVEAGTELLTGGAGKVIKKGANTLLKSSAKSVGKEVAEVGIKRVAKEAISEGAEEMISEVANPALKTIYKGKDALKEYSDEEFWGGVLEAGVIGAGTQMAYAGSVGRVTRQSGVYADANSVAEHIEQQKKMRGKSGLSQAERVQIEQNIKSDQELLSGRLQKLSEKKRAKVFEKMPTFKVMFEADGTIKAEQKAALDAKIKAAGDNTYNAEIRSSTASAERITEALKNGSTESHEMRAFTGEMTEAQRKNVESVREVMGAVSERSGEAIGDFVIAEKSPDGPAYFDETTGLMVIGMDAVENGTAAEEITRALEKAGWQEAVVHETWHGIENTKTGELLLKHIESNDALHTLATQDFLSRDYDTEFFGKSKAEAEKKLRALIAKAKSGETLTDAEQEAYDDYRSEVGGFANQRLFGNKAFMKKLITTEPSTAEMLIGKIREMRENLKARKDPEAREQLDFVRKAEKLFMQGLSEAGGIIDSKGKIHLANREEDDAEALTRENSEKTYISDAEGAENASEAASSEKEKSPKRGVRWSLRVKEKKGGERIVSPYEVTREEILEYMDMARKGVLENHTYFPVRSNLPRAIINSINAANIDAKDKPLAMQATKAEQSQKEGTFYTQDGVRVRCHAMKSYEVLETIDKLETPQIIIREAEHYEYRVNARGEKTKIFIPERFAIFVTLDSGKECVAVLEFDSEIDSKYLLKDGKGDDYHTTVTVFEPDIEYRGEPFDYAEALLSKDINSEIPIKAESPAAETVYTGTPGTEPEAELPTNSISQKSKKSTPSAQKNSGKVKRLMAGKKARTADKMKLATAQQMIAEGVDSETVRRETGWFQGYDGEWRFEIDDSQMEFSREGYGINELEKLMKEERKLVAEITYNEFENPDKDISELNERHKALVEKMKNTPAVTLPFYVKHDALFEAYPELRQVKVVLKPRGYSGGYAIKENEIRIDSRFSDEEIKSALLHEIQHVVQRLEGFSGGANATYWAQKIGEENPEAYETALDKLLNSRRDMLQNSSKSFLVKVRDFLRLTGNTKIQDYSPEQKAIFEDLEVDEEGWMFGRYMYHLQKVIELDQKFGKNHPYDMYLRTAGEVEARDTARRISLTAEQRKDIRPDIDRTNVLFADKESVFFGKDVTDFDNIILPDDVKYSGSNVQYEKRRYKQITKQEYAVISSRIAENNSKFMARNEPLPKLGVARSANYFYVYENLIPGEFGVLKQIEIDTTDKEYLSAIEEQIRSVNKSGTYTSTSDVNKMLDVLQGRRRRNRSNHADGSDGRSDRGNGRISPKESQGDGIGNTRGSNEDRRDVKRSRKQTGETVIETAENVSESSKSVRRLANPKSVDNLTEEQYNNFGWVRANDILESDEYERAMSDFASLKKGDQYRKTAEGEFVIPTSKYYGASEGTVSAIVFAKGEMDLPNITRIWLLNHSNSQTLKKVRGVICERLLERRNGTRDFVGDLYGEEFIGEYRASDFPTYQEYQNQLRQQREGEQSSGRRSGENYRNNQEQQYRGRNSQETGSVVISDSRLTPPSYAPVKQEYTDITKNKRYVIEHNKGEYFVWGTYSQHPYDLHPSIESAIEAENNSLLRAYAREKDHAVTWVKKRLQENPDFLKAWERKRLLKKIPGGKVSRSRNVSETVTLSKGQIAALRANYEGDKVFTKKEVAAAISTIDALQKMPAAMRNELVTHLWRGYNERLNEQGFEQFTEIMWHRIHAEILQESGFEMSEDEIAAMDEQIVNALEQIVRSGKPSVRAKLESATSTEGYRRQADFWRWEHSKAVQRNKQLNSLKFELEKLANQKKGLYVNAANYHGDDFKVAIDELAKMNWRGGLVNDTKIREHFAKLAAWYTKDNPLYKGDGGTGSLFRQEIADVLNSLGNSQNGALSVEDLQAAVTVAKYFAHEIEAHNTVFKDGKRVDAMPEAKDYIEKALRAKEIAAKCGIWSNLMRSKFARMVADPAMLMRQADGYLSGFFTEQYEALRQGTIDAAVLEHELSEEFRQFWEEHKAYAKRYNDATVKFDDAEMPLQEGIQLYMTMHREDAFAGLAGAGFDIEGKEAIEEISAGFADEVNRQLVEDWKDLPPEELLTLTKRKNAEMERFALKEVIEKKRQALYDQFTAEDKLLISIMEKGYNVDCRDVKVKIDEILHGDSNVIDGYYCPIHRIGLAENVDAYTGFEGDRVSNLSMNKETVKNAHKLLIEPAHIVFMRHLKATSLYHGLGVFTDNFNRLYNLDITGPQIKNAAERAVGHIDLSMDDELSSRVKGVYGAKRYKAIAEYIQKTLGRDNIKLSDGRMAVVDNRDAMHIANKAADKKTAQIARIKELVEHAQLFAKDTKAEHEKFDMFYYYMAEVTFEGETFPIYLNVGRAKNNGQFHIYDITNKIRDTADRINGLERPVGNALTNGIPSSSISQKASSVNTEELKNYRGGPKTVRDALGQSNKFAQEMIKYFKELKQDVEGISKKRSQEKWYNDVVAFVRSSYATFQLGANPKVWVTQLSSLIAATNIIDADCLVKGLTVSGKDVDEFCQLAWLRNKDNSAALALAVDNSRNAVQRAGRNVLQKVRDGSMWMIGRIDRLVIIRLFGACQVQVEKKGGAKVGTKENKIEAGKLLQRVILETQQNSLATERSAMMRSSDELLKGNSMFMADAMKNGGRFLDAFGKRSVLGTLRREAKKRGDTAEVKRLDTEIKQANKQCIRTTVSLVGVALFNAALAYGFKWLYRRDEEEDLGTFIADTFGNMLGGIPFVRDLWSFFQDGFEMDHFLISTVNDVLGTVSASFELVSDAASGKEVTRQQALANMRKVVYAAGQLSGVPTRNLYNFTTGVINRVSPEAGYAVESWFFKQSYASDLQKALDAGDENMIETIAGLMINEKIGIEDDAMRKTLQDLTSKGYKVLPRSVGDSVTVDGETVELTGSQQKKLREVYAIGQDAVADMVKLKQFAEADEKVQAAAIKFIYDVYWDLALEDALGVDLAEKNVLFAEAIDIEKLAVIIAMARSIEADKDKDGKSIAGTKKRKLQTFVNSLRLSAAEKYMVMGYLGYTNVNGEQQVMAYINKLNLNQYEKIALREYCGYSLSSKDREKMYTYTQKDKYAPYGGQDPNDPDRIAPK